MRILVGMSGGLDSTYAALKLRSEGHTVEGAVLVMHEYTEVEAAKSAANAIDIPLHIVDCRERFSAVKENFIEEYRSARTPNPCIICNALVKFRVLYEFAMENGFDKIATGHYAEVITTSVDGKECHALKRAKDSSKDQTYMLYRLGEDILSVLVLPLSGDEKSDIRKRAEEIGLEVAKRKDSQEICFIPDGNYAKYIEEHIGAFPEGDFISPNGKTLGRHKGIIRYTVGQRKGLGVAASSRIFVTSIDPVANTVTLSPMPKESTRVHIKDTVFSAISSGAAEDIPVYVKLRYQASPRRAILRILDGDRCELTLDEPERSVTPGQSAVLYDENGVVLAGGIVE